MKAFFDFLTKCVAHVAFVIISLFVIYLMYFPITVPLTIIIVLLVLIF